MTSFEELQTVYREQGPQAVLVSINALDATERLELLLENSHLRKRAYKVESDNAEELPDAYRKIKTRWNFYDYVLSYLDGAALRQHMAPHVAFETDGGTYLRNALALLVWKSTDVAKVEVAA